MPSLVQPDVCNNRALLSYQRSTPPVRVLLLWLLPGLSRKHRGNCPDTHGWSALRSSMLFQFLGEIHQLKRQHLCSSYILLGVASAATRLW